MAVLDEVKNMPGFLFMACPGCGVNHHVNVDMSNGKPTWEWNGDRDKPTFSPSILVTYEYGEPTKVRRCHSFIRNGVWEFLPDCTHELAGQLVPMIEVE